MGGTRDSSDPARNLCVDRDRVPSENCGRTLRCGSHRARQPFCSGVARSGSDVGIAKGRPRCPPAGALAVWGVERLSHRGPVNHETASTPAPDWYSNLMAGQARRIRCGGPSASRRGRLAGRLDTANVKPRTRFAGSTRRQGPEPTPKSADNAEFGGRVRPPNRPIRISALAHAQRFGRHPDADADHARAEQRQHDSQRSEPGDEHDHAHEELAAGIELGGHAGR